MTFEKKNWQNNPPSSSSPITADELNRIEDGIHHLYHRDYHGLLPGSTDLDTLRTKQHAGFYALSNVGQYEGVPADLRGGVLEVVWARDALNVVQRITSATRTAWRELEGASGNFSSWSEPEMIVRSISLDNDGTPYGDSSGTHKIVLDTDGTPRYIPYDQDLVTFNSEGNPELTYAPTGFAPLHKAIDSVRTTAEGAQESVGRLNDDLEGVVKEEAQKAVTERLEEDLIPEMDTWSKDRNPVFNVKMYGAKGDGVSDDLPAFQQAYSDAIELAAATIYIPSGIYRLSDEWMIWRANNPRRDIVIEGEDQLTTIIRAGFYGAGKALINGRSPEGIRSSPTTLRNLQVGTIDRNGPSPCLIDLDFWSEGRMDHVRFGPANSTHLRGSSLQNIRAYDVVSYFGGKSYTYKNTDGINFTVSQAAKTISASEDIFEERDTGKLFFITPTNAERRIVYTLGQYVDARTMVIAEDTKYTSEILEQQQDTTQGFFDAARATVTAGSEYLTANASCFDQDDVGRVLVIQNAEEGHWGPGLFRAHIVSVVSPTTVVLNRPADISVTETPFAQPVIDFHAARLPGRAGSATTDVKLTNLQVEGYAGLGFSLIRCLQMHVINQKIHGLHAPNSVRSSTGMAWLDNSAGTFSGELDGQTTSDSRLYFSNMNDTLSIPFLSSRRVRNEVLFQMEQMTEAGALVEIKTLVVYRDDREGPLEYILDRNHEAGNDYRLVYTGTVTSIGGTTNPRIYSGMGTWFNTSGDMVMTSPDGTEYQIGITDNGTLEITSLSDL